MVIERTDSRKTTPIDKDVIISAFSYSRKVNTVPIIRNVKLIVAGQFVTIQRILFSFPDLKQVNSGDIVLLNDIGSNSNN